MAAVELYIAEPQNDAAFSGSPTLTFRGGLIRRPPELADVALYFRWYSSLHPARHEEYAMSPALTAAEESFENPSVPMGSQVITFAASDRQGETDADFKAMQHGGVTGGLEGEGRCVIHVFRANILVPDVPPETFTLQAEAPVLWAKSVNHDGKSPYAFNKDYHAYNRLRYRWRLEPIGAPSGRPTLEFIPDPEDRLIFDAPSDESPLPSVSYQPTLPSAAVGEYRIVLYVEDARGEGLGQHQAQITVTLDHE
jgi:hypothetical protein